MKFEDKILLSRLDGFLDATSLVKSINRDLLCAAIVIEGTDFSDSVADSIEGHYSDEDAKVTFLEQESNWLPWIERELTEQFQGIDDKLKFELVWQQVEALRILTEDKEVVAVAKYELTLSGFKGFCYPLEIDDDLVVVQFLSRIE
jgi:hypothetical protein